MAAFSLSRQDTSIMKGIAICAMLLHHLYASPITESIESYGGLLRWIGIVGKVCVSIFLFCSGYGMSVQYRKVESWSDSTVFLRRRLIKLYTNFWVVYAIFVPITVFFFNRPLSAAYGYHTHLYKEVASVFLDLLCIPSPWRSPYNVTWWFNQLILVMYLLFPLTIWFVRKAGVVISLAAGFLVFCFYQHIPFGMNNWSLWQFSFLLGIVWSFMENRIPDRYNALVKGRYSSWIAVLVLVILTFLRMTRSRFWTGLHMDAFITVALAFFVLSLQNKESYFCRTFAFLGKHSINIYLIHTFLNGYWHPEWLHTSAWMRCGANFFILMSICIVMSMTLELLKERLGIYKLSNIIIG